MQTSQTKNQITKTVITCSILILMSSCSAFWNGYQHQKRQGSASSLVEYLYPDGRIPPGMAERIPNIKIPMRLGIAFVPSHSHNAFVLTESHKQLLLEKVKKEFIKRPDIQSIHIMPSHYLVRKGGFNDLRRVAAIYGVDQVALISHDQAGFIHENPLSLTYWTIVGAYIIPGNSHDIQTFVDTAVIDVKTTKLIMRAAGNHKLKRASTVVHLKAKFRQAGQQGFVHAVDNMIGNLNIALDEFKVRLRQGSKEAKISYRPGFSGSTDTVFLLLTVLIVFISFKTVKSKQNPES